uniref:Protein kinase domain-containing protein n=1 Tax=Kalanchoe fedtschenkoi TaxID=63787 RepID=A0A7N0UPG8_KALFE
MRGTGGISPIILLWLLMAPVSHQLQTSQVGVLLQLRKHLEYPSQLSTWYNYYGDLCFLTPTPSVSIACENASVTELRIAGDRTAKPSHFHGYAIANVTLSVTFSVDSFFTTLTRLVSLRVLSLVGLGMWGPIPDKIHRLSSLELLDMSSNFFYGSVPPQMARLTKLNTLRLDANFFNDTIPDWLESLSNLTVLSLKSNRLKGQFPPSICKTSTLADIALSHNDLSGKLPDLSRLTGLHVLDLMDNQFSSDLPTLPKGLVTALLSRNSFSGNIPSQFGELIQLQHIDLSFNALSGSVPSSLFSLPKISYLNLASNMLSGMLPANLNCGSELGFVDLSDNQLVGQPPACLGASSGERVVSVDGNCLSIDNKKLQQESHCKVPNMIGRHNKLRDIRILAGLTGGALIFVMLLAFGIFIFWKQCQSVKRRPERHVASEVLQNNMPSAVPAEILANARLISRAAKLGDQGAPTYRIFSMEEIEAATNNFDKLMLLGEGSNGKIYMGKLENGCEIAIRCLVLPKRSLVQNLKVKLDMLSRLHHPHLVNLLGYCLDTSLQDDLSSHRVFLVNEYVPNGNFHYHLSVCYPEKTLKWPDRLSILIGVAKAVLHLHTGVIPGIFNNKLKTHNVLLDEHQIPKLSDYGLAILEDEMEKREAKGDGPNSWQIAGMKDDVYDFGFILLESLVGHVIKGKGEAFLINEMASFGSQDGLCLLALFNTESLQAFDLHN